MKDKEMIEEMAKEIEKAKQHIWASVRTQAEDEDYLWHSRAIAEHLMLQGYRKLPEDSVVLSREEYESITDNIAIDIIRKVFETIDWSKNTNSFEKGILKLISEYSIDLEIEEQARKETAEKILKWLKEHCDFVGFGIVETYFREEFGVKL